ncbi:MAG: DNA polymerase IV [Halioglobus sp.]
MQRKIIHIDADSFYASVETRENPGLRGKPLAVGGRADRRGVIATANYEARSFGVHSAMASSRAMILCPGLLILPPRFDLYREASARFHDIFRHYTQLIEPLSLDEAFLDVTETDHCHGSATLIAQEIRQRVKEELSLTVSAGIAPNKFLAKVASDWNKPDGMFVIRPEQIAAFVVDLPVKKINGVGKVTAEKLRKMGVVTCGDLQTLPLEKLAKRFGKYGQRLYDVARGVDHRQVQSSRVRKSISVERTFVEDIEHLPAMVESIDDLLLELKQRFDKIAGRYFPIKRVVKIKYNDFTQTTLEEVIGASGEPWHTAEQFHRLLTAAWPRGAKPVRLLGAGLRLQPRDVADLDQLSLFGVSEDAAEFGAKQAD